MPAVDSNVAIRYLTRDDQEQAARALALIKGSPFWLSLTVALEIEWALRKGYRYTPADILNGFAVLLGEPMIRVEDPAVLSQAMIWFEGGLDFADALHLACAISERCTGFATFDEPLGKNRGSPWGQERGGPVGARL
jgi:predicted nucleic-acid-binding protein